jgi:acetyl-CoA C-acetyltransferase
MTRSSNNSTGVVITHALRSPIGKFMGGLSTMTGVDMGASVLKSLLKSADLDPVQVGEVILGNARQAGAGPNPARQIAIGAGLPETTCAMTINMACGSGLKTIQLAADSIRLGRAEVAIAGGTESMSGLPFFLPKFRAGYRLGHERVVDAMYQDGFECPLADMLMGATAEKLAQERDITRTQQDEFALRSQELATQAVKEGRFNSQIVPVEVTGRRGALTVIDKDEHIRAGSSLEKLGKLPAVFAENGTVSAGNASGITDGAAALLLMTEERAQALGYEVLAHVGPTTQAGVDPTIMGIGPVSAVRALCEQTGRGCSDYELVELNEAFAAQVIACQQELEFDPDKLNVNGGSIALGHPIGATGARIVVTLLHEMKRRDLNLGLATLCISGGMGIATEFTR